MRIIADLQIHSRFARACSRNTTLPLLEKWARIKGISLLGTGDFTHPVWSREMGEQLTDDGTGILTSKTGYPFLCQSEVSLMYSAGGRGRRVHLLMFAPSLDVVTQITDALKKRGRVDYDGRPIFKITCPEFVDMLRSISPDTEVVPAHSWTPYFGIFGSKSGFDSLQEAFGDRTKYIHAIETGLSSDPAMNWRLSQLDPIQIVSFSDAHCVHPDTLITGEDGYVFPINEGENENSVGHADIKTLAYGNGAVIQFSKIPAPKTLYKITYRGGEILTSAEHRFFVKRGRWVREKYAKDLERGDVLFRLARTPHNDRGSSSLVFPHIETYYKIEKQGLLYIREQREKKRIRQKDVANALGIYKDHYWKIENGYIKINKPLLETVSNLLGFNNKTFVEKYAKENTPFICFPGKTSIELLELLGYFIGDGCFTKINKGRCLILTDKNRRVLEYYKNTVKKLFGYDARLFKYTTKNSYGLLLSSYIAQFFEKNFPEAVQKSKKRRVPRLIYTAPLPEVAGFLRGFFDAEGCVDDHSVSGVSANKILLYQVDALLKKFGICSSLYLNILERTKKKYRHRITLYGENLKVFKERISFNHIKKQEKLKVYLNSLQIKRKSKPKRKGDFVYAQVTAVETVPSDTEHLYDIAVPGYENYIANQVLVHNSFWPWRLGREVTVFDAPSLSYNTILHALRTGEGLAETWEVDPAYGKYHWDGHRLCNIVLSPEESKKLRGLCPKCGQPLTIGVENRVLELADRPAGHRSTAARPFRSLIPLSEIISLVHGGLPSSKPVWEMYNKLIAGFGNEFFVLNDAPAEKIAAIDPTVSQAIAAMRAGTVTVKPGYDGVYGVPQFPGLQTKMVQESDEEAADKTPKPKNRQRSLGEF